MDTIRLKARAKINLGLDVVRRREDGYHEVRMVMQMLKLYDQIDIEKTETPGIRLTCNLSFLPTDERNIAYKAAKVMMEQFEIKQGVCIRIEKHIPVAAGMAGGSTDCAAVLYGMNKLFDLQLSQKKLREIGVKLGADVPFFFYGGTAYAAGIGEEIQPLPYLGDVSVVLAKGKGGISTAAAYAAMDALQNPPHPNVPEMKQRLQAYAEPKDLAPLCGNLFAEVTELPIVQKLQQEMLARGAFASLMTGSGSAVFGLFSSQEPARKCCSALRKVIPFVAQCKTIPHTFYAI